MSSCPCRPFHPGLRCAFSQPDPSPGNGSTPRLGTLTQAQAIAREVLMGGLVVLELRHLLTTRGALVCRI
jgi:hypothetical protein